MIILIRLRLLIIFLTIPIAILEGAKWDTEYWQYLTLKTWKKNDFDLKTVIEYRLNHGMRKLYYFRVGENLAYRGVKHVDFEVHYSFLRNRNRGALAFRNTQRLELEINPYFEFENGVLLRWRNRLEILKHQHEPQLQYVFRHRFSTLFPLKNNTWIAEYRFYNEIFYNFDTKSFTTNELVPLEVALKLNEKSRLNIFLMIRNFNSNSAWYRSVILGTDLVF